ncbi:MAG: hypothetical protein E7248_11200 [Paenibacillaceae bacterium]|nr:hypothetical protein [Paenibacillaceae bacterium]
MIILFFLFISSFSIFIAAIINSIKTHKYEERTEAQIININESYHNYKLNKIYTYYPIYQYEVNNIIYRIEFPFGEDSPESIPIGKTVIIKYNRNNPEEFFVCGKEYVWRVQAILSFVITIIMLSIIIVKSLGL